MSGKEIWLPSTETRVQVVDGKVTVWDEILMELKPVRERPGFGERPRGTTRQDMIRDTMVGHRQTGMNKRP